MVDLTAAPSADAAPAQRLRSRRAPPVRRDHRASSRSSSRRWRARAGRAAGVRPNEAIARVEKAHRGADRRHPPAPRGAPAGAGLARAALPRGAGAEPRRRPHRRRQRAPRRDGRRALLRAVRANASTEPPVSCAIVDTVVDGTAPLLRPARGPSPPGFAEAYDVAGARLEQIGPAPRRLHDLAKGGAASEAAFFAAPEQAPWRTDARRSRRRCAPSASRWDGGISATATDGTRRRSRGAVIELPSDEVSRSTWRTSSPWACSPW